MAKFNEVQKKRRAIMSERKRNLHGDPHTRKLKNKPHSHSISGKRHRKLLRKWRRDQKEMIEKGLVTLQQDDVDMDAASSQESNKKTPPPKFHLKKILKLKSKHTNHKGKKQVQSSHPAVEAPSVDAMLE